MSLEAATIRTEHTDTGTATLDDGEFRAPVAPGSASELVIRLSQWTVGDLDGDGIADAAAITIEDPGGSGNFRYLHALLNEEGELHDGDAVFLGDRIRVEGLSIHEGVITVALARPAAGRAVRPRRLRSSSFAGSASRARRSRSSRASAVLTRSRATTACPMRRSSS